MGKSRTRVPEELVGSLNGCFDLLNRHDIFGERVESELFFFKSHLESCFFAAKRGIREERVKAIYMSTYAKKASLASLSISAPLRRRKDKERDKSKSETILLDKAVKQLKTFDALRACVRGQVFDLFETFFR